MPRFTEYGVAMPLTYSEYLKLDGLLELQKPLSPGPEHDELLFIVIHQVYELWFKQVLHETDRLQSCFAGNDATGALAALKRVLTILKTMVSQVDVLETMTPLSFSSFRSLLESSSGFQSVQFREFEIRLGKRDVARLKALPLPKPAVEKLLAAAGKPSVYDSFLAFLLANGQTVPKDALARDFTTTYEGDERVQRTLVEVYRGFPNLAQVCERLVDLDEGVQEWRYRHVKMVERTIGMKMGTGGSPGVEYLKMTLFRPAFPDLWAIRKEF